MKKQHFLILPAALCALLQAPAGAGVPAVAEREIQYLLEFVATSVWLHQALDTYREKHKESPVTP